MSLETLAAEITKQAKEEAGAILEEARAEAKRIKKKPEMRPHKLPRWHLPRQREKVSKSQLRL